MLSLMSLPYLLPVLETTFVYLRSEETPRPRVHKRIAESFDAASLPRVTYFLRDLRIPTASRVVEIKEFQEIERHIVIAWDIVIVIIERHCHRHRETLSSLVRRFNIRSYGLSRRFCISTLPISVARALKRESGSTIAIRSRLYSRFNPNNNNTNSNHFEFTSQRGSKVSIHPK